MFFSGDKQMQTHTEKTELFNLIELLPVTETNTVKTFIEFVLSKSTPSKSRKVKSKEDNFDEFVKFCEGKSQGKPLSKREKKAVAKAMEEREKNKYFTLDELAKLRREKHK